MGPEVNEQCRRAVADGATLLDDRKPNWYQFVNLDTLDQSSVQFCILGQNYGSYSSARRALNLGHAESIERGFNGGNMPLWSAEEETEAWHGEILKRRKLASATEGGEEEQSEQTEEVFDLSDYHMYELPNGKCIFVPTEMVDKMYVELRSLGSTVERVLLEWEA